MGTMDVAKMQGIGTRVPHDLPADRAESPAPMPLSLSTAVVLCAAAFFEKVQNPIFEGDVGALRGPHG